MYLLAVEANLTQRQKGKLMVKSIPQLSLKAIYPHPTPEINLNTCGDIDCGNFGVEPDFTLPVFKGNGAAQRKLLASVTIPALATGRGGYSLTSSDRKGRISQAFEYQNDPRAWDDGREIACHHQKGNGECGIEFNILSNAHLLEEIDRLKTHNGLLEGPVCGHCGVRYLDRSEEFIFNGTHGKLAPEGNRRKEKASGFRMIHKPCKGKPGARISATLDHQGQKKQHDNVRLLRALVNGSSINALARLLSDPDSGKKCGISRIYSRIFWLEKTMLAFEQAKLREWKKAQETSGRFIHTRIAHDDVTISINWESRQDRRLTPLLCSVSADIRSGYVFRIDANFDTRVDPASFIEEHFIDDKDQPKNIREHYKRKSTGKIVSAPKLHFQRPSGRFDEAAFFASAEGSWRVFSERIARAYEADIAAGIALPPELQDKLDHAQSRRDLLDEIRTGYFGLGDVDRDFRGSFKGIVVKPTYTKAAHLACLRDMLPAGKITLIGEREAAMGRVVPHIFRDLIQADLFEWMVVAFDKEASTPKTQARIKKFEEALKDFADLEILQAGIDIPRYELLKRFCSRFLKPATNTDRFGNAYPFATATFVSKQFPQFWAASPVQHFGETEKKVGFPIIRKEYRTKLKSAGFDQDIKDTELRDALARRILYTTIQPVSSFMNSLRRISPTKRAGGKSARNGPSYINGAVFNPAVLIAMLNIYRVYYNWFEARQYVGSGTAGKGTEEVEMGLSSIRVPGSQDFIQVPKRRAATPVMRTPAMRLGADSESEKAPDPRRVLYRPWLYHGTPLWRKFETR